MFAVLLDVSGSMREAYSRNRSHDTSVRRTHAVLTTTAEIVKQEVTRHNRHDSIFTCAFGLSKPTTTCDLIPLLEALRESRQGAPYDALILAREERAPHAERWIRQHLTKLEAAVLNRQLRLDRSLIPGLIARLPSPETSAVTGFVSNIPIFGLAYELGESVAVHRSEAYSYAQDVVAKGFTLPSPRSVQYVSKLMDDLLKKRKPMRPDDSTQDQIQQLIDAIEPYIYGKSRCFKSAIFLSDVESTDGNPLPIAEHLRALGVQIVTCYLTADHIKNPKRLLYAKDTKWGEGQSVLFEMSSTMHNTHTPVSYLVDHGWKLPPYGESCLFLQANSLDVVDELCDIVVSHMADSCDALVDCLEKVPLATYINQANADFVPKEQDGGTCYANAIAAVFHLAMQRIVGREGGILDFYKIRHDIILKNMVKMVPTLKRSSVLEKLCSHPEYRLRFHEVNETGARKDINKRRPVVATFWLYDEEWSKFSQFFDQSKKGILKKRDVDASGRPTEPGGHAVVLIRCDLKHDFHELMGHRVCG